MKVVAFWLNPENSYLGKLEIGKGPKGAHLCDVIIITFFGKLLI